MKKRLLIALVLTTIVGQLIFGQVKNYNGAFNSLNFHGIASYNYLDQSNKRAFSGPFSFTSEDNRVNIKGNYQNDLKHGIWYFDLSNVVHSELIIKYSITSNISGAFNKGNVDGPWTLSRSKVISFSSTGISSYYQNSLKALSFLFDNKTIDLNKSKTVTEKSTVNFKDNHFFGSFLYNINNGNSLVKGQYNEMGYFEGIWTVDYFMDGILHIQTRTYKNGVLLKVKNNNTSTGKNEIIYDNTDEVNEFFNNFNSSENASKINDVYYKLIESKTSYVNLQLFEDAIDIWYNNTSLANSACLFEIERGTNKLSVYPGRIIIIDRNRTEKLKQEEENKKEELRAKQKEKKKIELDQQRQEIKRIEEEEKKIKEFENSDYGRIKKSIEIEFLTWLEKGEFETQADHEQRIKLYYQTEFNEIAQNQISKSKEKYISVLSGAVSGVLSEYDTDSQTFKVKLFSERFRQSIQVPSVLINIPPNLAQNLEQKYCREKASHGDPLLIHIFDVAMINNYWVPSRLFIIFSKTSSVFNSRYWNNTRIVDKGGYFGLIVPLFSVKPCHYNS